MKNVRSILFAIVGVLSIYVSIWMRNMNSGNIETPREYGGEAYTGIQNAEVRTGANIYFQSEIIKEGFADVLLITGMVLIIVALPVRTGFSNKSPEKLA